MAGSWQRLKSINSALFPQLESIKHGRLGKVYNIYTDYRDVMKNILFGAKKHPVKFIAYSSVLTALSYVWINNPDQDSYVEDLVKSSNKLLLVSDLIRSKSSNRYVREMMDLHTNGCLTSQSLGFCTFILRTPFPKELDLYEKHCYYVQPRWFSARDRVVDLGFCGRWFYLERQMIDFDVNEDEFDN